MKILITGCCGFIGSHLSKRLSSSHEIIGIDNLSYGNIDNIKDININFIQGDICNETLLRNINVDLIIHLASQKIPRYDNAYRTLEENYQMNRVILNKCIRDKSKILFASTSEVYGKNTSYPLSETSDCIFGNPYISRWAYGLSKYHAEQYIISVAKQFNIDYLICRFFSIYGRNQAQGWWGGVQSAFINNIKSDIPIEIHSTGEQKRIFTYIDDLCDAIELLLPHQGVYNIAGNSNDEISMYNLALLIYKILNKEPNITYIPYPENYEDTNRKVPNISKLSALGYSPKTSLEEGLMKILL
jgi:UDP-glucose 4-epimerase